MKKRNREKTIQNIRKAAISIFETKGFLEGSTEDIAKKAHVAHGTIFFYFPTKADLIVAAIYTKMETLADKLNEKSRRTTDIKQLCRIYWEEISKYPEFYSRLVKDLPHLPLDLQRSVFSSLSGFSIHFVDVIEAGQKRGNIPRFDPKLAVFSWFGLVNYLYSYRELLGTEDLSESEIEDIVSFFAKSITTT